MSKKITHIFWDFNGTILDDLELCCDILNTMLKKYNRPTVTLDEYLMIFDFPVRDYYNKVFDLNKTPFDMLAHEFMDHYQKNSLKLKLHDDVIETIQYFNQKGVTNILLSASERSRLEEQINHYHIKDLFKDVLGTSNIYATSKLDVFKAYLKEKHIDCNHICLIGDTLHDAHLAQSCQASIVLYSKGHQHPKRLKNYKTIDHFKALIDIINI